MKKLMLSSLIVFILSLASGLFADSAWKSDFSTMDGWYDNAADPNFNATITAGTQPGTADITQKGDGTWGKVAFVQENVDIDKNSVIKINMADVPKGSGYKVLAVTPDWSESFIVIDRGHGKGIAQGNIKDVTGWSGVKTFNLVIIIEGEKKKITVNSIELISKESAAASAPSKPAAESPKKGAVKK